MWTWTIQTKQDKFRSISRRINRGSFHKFSQVIAVSYSFFFFFSRDKNLTSSPQAKTSLTGVITIWRYKNFQPWCINKGGGGAENEWLQHMPSFIHSPSYTQHPWPLSLVSIEINHHRSLPSQELGSWERGKKRVSKNWISCTREICHKRV